MRKANGLTSDEPQRRFNMPDTQGLTPATDTARQGFEDALQRYLDDFRNPAAHVKLTMEVMQTMLTALGSLELHVQLVTDRTTPEQISRLLEDDRIVLYNVDIPDTPPGED